MLSKRADVNSKTAKDMTPLDLANKAGSWLVYNAIEKAGGQLCQTTEKDQHRFPNARSQPITFSPHAQYMLNAFFATRSPCRLGETTDSENKGILLDTCSPHPTSPHFASAM